MVPGLTQEQQKLLDKYAQQEMEKGRDYLVAHWPAGMTGTTDASSSGMDVPILLGIGALVLFLLVRGR